MGPWRLVPAFISISYLLKIEIKQRAGGEKTIDKTGRGWPFSLWYANQKIKFASPYQRQDRNMPKIRWQQLWLRVIGYEGLIQLTFLSHLSWKIDIVLWCVSLPSQPSLFAQIPKSGFGSDFSWKDQCKERREIWGSHAVHSSEDFFPGVEVNIAVSARFKSSQEDCWSWTWLQFVSEWTESDEVIGDGQRCEDIEQQKDHSRLAC